MTRLQLIPPRAGDFESPTSASSVIRATGAQRESNRSTPEVTAQNEHNPRHTFGAVEHDSGDILPFRRPMGVLGGQRARVSRAVSQGWRYGHLDLVPPDGPTPPRAA